MIHHPQEQVLISIRKIEQIIGKQAPSKNRSRNFIIFDGKFWEHFTSELEIDLTHTSTQKELKLFSEIDSFADITKKLLELSKKLGMLKIGMQDFQNFVMPVAIMLEDYLNKYDYAASFRRNLLDALRNATSPSDKSFEEKLKSLLITLPSEIKDKKEKLIDKKEKKEKKENEIERFKKRQDSFEQIRKLVEDFKAETESSIFKSQFLDGYKMFLEIYKKRMLYSYMNIERMEEKKKLAMKQNIEAISKFKKENYKEAEILFLRMLQVLSGTCLKTDPELASIHYNLGKCYLKMDNKERAKLFLQEGLNLKKTFTFPTPSKTEIQKMQDALIECTS